MRAGSNAPYPAASCRSGGAILSAAASSLRGMAKQTARERTPYRCAECGWQTAKWVGRCGECQAWGAVEDASAPRARTTAAGPVTTAAVPIGEVDVASARSRPTGIGELDRVLGGGLVPGAVVLLAGEPGVGKSTLLLDVAAKVAAAGGRTLYVTGEESTAQVRLRAGRIGALHERLLLAAETDLAAVLGHIDAVQPELLVLDSVQTFASSSVEGSPGGVTQVREVAAALIRVAKERGIATVLVGHVTKDGSIAGPRLLEHLVDVVLQFEGERHSRLRLVRAAKNRYGTAEEVGCFDLGDEGIVELPDPTGLFLSRHTEPVPGTCVTAALEGRRPLLAEVQALVSGTSPGTPRRAVSGLDGSRVAMVLAVLMRSCRFDLAQREVYAATVGGVRVTEPAADLALALALGSSSTERPIPSDVVAIGEVGLAGEIRPVTALARRLAEASRLGFRRALVPPDPGLRIPAGMRVVEVADIRFAFTAVWM